MKRAYIERAWAALGYDGWDDYCTREFGTSRLRLPREERSEVVASLRESGLSIRAIAAATGDHYSTVSRELSKGRVADATPADPGPITGTDGKTYAPTTTKPAPSPIVTNDYILRADRVNARSADKNPHRRGRVALVAHPLIG